jgi:hypothetical protein
VVCYLLSFWGERQLLDAVISLDVLVEELVGGVLSPFFLGAMAIARCSYIIGRPTGSCGVVNTFISKWKTVMRKYPPFQTVN